LYSGELSENWHWISEKQPTCSGQSIASLHGDLDEQEARASSYQLPQNDARTVTIVSETSAIVDVGEGSSSQETYLFRVEWLDASFQCLKNSMIDVCG